MSETRPDGLDGTVPMREGGAQRSRSLYPEHIDPPPEQDTTTPAMELKFRREGVDPVAMCPRCGAAIANEGRAIHCKWHHDQTAAHQETARVLVMIMDVLGMTPAEKQAEVTRYLSEGWPD